MGSSKSPVTETGGTVEEIGEGNTTVDAEVELLDLILSGVGVSEVMEVEPLSVEGTILDVGKRVTDGASELVEEIAREPF